MATAEQGSRSKRDFANGRTDDVGRADRRLSTETKSSLKTTELIVYIGAVAAVLVAAMIVDQSDNGGLGAQQAWLYVTLLSVGYMISRGLAKSGSRDFYTDDTR